MSHAGVMDLKSGLGSACVTADVTVDNQVEVPPEVLDRVLQVRALCRSVNKTLGAKALRRLRIHWDTKYTNANKLARQTRAVKKANLCKLCRLADVAIARRATTSAATDNVIADYITKTCCNQVTDSVTQNVADT